MNPLKKWLSLVGAASVVPLLNFAVPFGFGFCNPTPGFSMFVALILLLISVCGSITAAIFVAIQAPGLSKPERFGIGFLTWAVTVALCFTIPGAKSWTLGIAANFHLTKHPEQIQKWAVGVLNRYEAGQLSTSTNAHYWAAGREKLADSDIPGPIQTLWRHKPEIGIATMTSDGWLTDSLHTNSLSAGGLTGVSGKNTHCVAFSWYLTGILVGRPGFRPTWNPWYIHEITPGVYAYCGGK